MLLSPIYSTNFQAKIPLSEYKGTILKLTTKDKKKITELIEQKTLLEFEINTIDKLLDKKKTIIESSYLIGRRSKLQGDVDAITDKIKEIKVTRLNKQKAKAVKLNLMV